MLCHSYRSVRRFVLSLILLLTVSSPFVRKAASHPLGNFTVNHFTKLTIENDHVQITCVIDIAEIPAFTELRSADTNGDGKTSQTELTVYLTRVASGYAKGLLLTVDGQPESFINRSQRITVHPGAGGLSTLRLEYEFLGKSHAFEPGISHDLHFEDNNQQDRIGWREIAVSPEANITVFNSSAFSNSISNELLTYPADMLSSPLNERTARLSWVVGPAPSGAVLLSTRTGRRTVASRDRFAELISVRKLTPGVMLLGLLIAAILGAAHALSPGHGKTVVGAYLVGSRGTPAHAAFLGLTVTITHTAGVFALGLITLFASRYILPERLFPLLSLASGALVACIGFSLFTQRVSALLRDAPEQHEHEEDDHPHTHVHSHGGQPHSHLPPGTNGDPVSWSSLLALGISGGLLPCPSALVVLLSAIALHRAGYGLLLVLAFSVGLAATLTGIGLAFVYAGRALKRFASLPKFESLQHTLPILSAFAVACLGLAISYGSLDQMGLDPTPVLQHGLQEWHAVVTGQESLGSLGAWAVLAFGLILGFKHATEADHVIAVSSIVSEHRKIRKVAFIGGLWGLGHTLTLVIVGFFVLALGVVVPERISQYFEFAVGLMIIVLSGTALGRVLRGRADLHVHSHRHGYAAHSHLHFHEQGVERNELLNAHSHAITRIGLKPLLVGAMHGLAGSAALTLLVLTQVHSLLLGLSYLLIFGIGSVFGMMLVSTLIGLPFALGAHRLRRATLGLQVAAGLIGVAFGCWYAFSVGTTAFGQS